MISKRHKKELKISQEWIHNYSLHYLGRYSSSSKNLERVIKKKLIKLSRDNNLLDSQIEKWIKMTIKMLEKNRMLDDTEYSKSKALSLFRSGKSSKIIYAKLKILGISDENINNALSNVVNNFIDSSTLEDLDYKAAIIFARKKNIPLESLKNEPLNKINKNIQKFNNAGFSISTIKKLVDLDLIDHQN
ncbi:MAG: Regulatory protein RecX [Alphaproteobacteria bacterium MarineAlpha2_Bin1]|nr:MAG: Regulatory protein RecX [Alphaproteobacteria bacterium MarineAlpha2_Bin1]|tara:strand:+ start:247 stop:813 length:567 start_codon:yes stop_codon:yes gene_type:complete